MMSFPYGIKKACAAVCVLACLLTLSSCASVDMNIVDMEPSVCMNDPTQVTVLAVKHFKKDLKAHFGLFGFATWSEPNIRKALEDEISKNDGNGIINLSISTHYGLLDTLLGIPLSPLWFQRTYRVEGDVVIMKAPAGKGLPKLEF